MSRQNTYLLWPVLACLGLLLGGCATLDKEECQSADWYAIGYEDGLKGRAATRVASHRKACAEYGISPDVDEYRRGYRVGVRLFCVPETGYRLGRRGSSSSATCPADLAGPFSRAYREGRRIYLAERELRQWQHELGELNEELEAVQAQLRENEGALLMGEQREQQHRRRLLRDYRELLGREAALETELAALDEAGGPERGRGGDDKRDENNGNAYGRERDNPGNAYGRDREPPGNAYGRDREPPGNAYGRERQPPGNAYGREEDNPGNAYGRERNGNNANARQRAPAIAAKGGNGAQGNQRRQLQRELQLVRRAIRAKERELRSAGFDQDRQQQLFEQGQQLAREEGRLSGEIEQLERRIERGRAEVVAMERSRRY